MIVDDKKRKRLCPGTGITHICRHGQVGQDDNREGDAGAEKQSVSGQPRSGARRILAGHTARCCPGPRESTKVLPRFGSEYEGIAQVRERARRYE